MLLAPCKSMSLSFRWNSLREFLETVFWKPTCSRSSEVMSCRKGRSSDIVCTNGQGLTQNHGQILLKWRLASCYIQAAAATATGLVLLLQGCCYCYRAASFLLHSCCCYCDRAGATATGLVLLLQGCCYCYRAAAAANADLRREVAELPLHALGDG